MLQIQRESLPCVPLANSGYGNICCPSGDIMMTARKGLLISSVPFPLHWICHQFQMSLTIGS